MRTTANSLVLPGRIPSTSSHSPLSRGWRVGGPEQTTRPPGDTSLETEGRRPFMPPAQRIRTAPNAPMSSPGTFSARALTTRVRSKPSPRMTAARKEARRWRDSMRVTSRSGSTIFSGIPGNPAPDPTSATAMMSRGSARRNSRLSRKRCSTIHAGSDDPTSLWTCCHLRSRSRYLWNDSSS